MKHKIQEVSRQLTAKEEEIINVKRRFKEERTCLEQDKKSLTKQLERAKILLDEVDTKFRDYRKEQDESPIAVLRTEI